MVARIRIDGKEIELYEDIETFTHSHPKSEKAKHFKNKIKEGEKQVAQFHSQMVKLGFAVGNVTAKLDLDGVGFCVGDILYGLIEPEKEYVKLDMRDHKDFEIIEGKPAGHDYYKVIDGEIPAYLLCVQKEKSKLKFLLRLGC
jgi:hypothetical protein